MLPHKKILIIGLGSMGQRRIGNLLHNKIKKSQIFGLDERKSQAKKISQNLKIKTFSNFKEAYRTIDPDILIIATPPNQHSFYFLKAAKDNKHFFVETGISLQGYKKLIPILKKKSIIAFPSNTFHFYPAIKKIKSIISSNKIGRILHFNLHSGQYILYWKRPWENYTKSWFSQKSSGAGREMFIFQLRWINDIFGFPKDIRGVISKFSKLPISADDIHSAILNYPNKIVGHITVDTLTRKPEVVLNLIGTKGELKWSWQDFKIELSNSKSNKIIPIKRGSRLKGYIATEEMYNNEIKEFLLCIKNNSKPPYSFADDYKLLKILESLSKSSSSLGKISNIIKLNKKYV